MSWFETDPRRLEKEIELMVGRTHANLHRSGHHIFWVENLRSQPTGVRYQLVIDYPGDFPYAPPRAYVTRPTIRVAPHRFSDGSLCVFESGATGVKTTALVVRNRAVIWFLTYQIWRACGEWVAPEHR